MSELQILKVSSKSVPNRVASAAVGMTKEGATVALQGIGAGAISQATKAVAIANKFVEDEDFRFVTDPQFVDLVIDGKERTGIKIVLETVKK